MCKVYLSVVNVLLAFHLVVSDVCYLYDIFSREGLGLDNEHFFLFASFFVVDLVVRCVCKGY